MPFWDHQALLDEANEVNRIEGVVHRKNYTGPCFFHDEKNYPELLTLKQTFESIYGEFGLVTAGYIFGYPGDQYDWHSDGNTERALRHKWEDNPTHEMWKRFSFHKFERGQEVTAGFNIVLEGTDPVEFQKNQLKEVYNAAILAVDEQHRVIVTQKRIVAVLQFRDATYDEVVQRVIRVDNDSLF